VIALGLDAADPRLVERWMAEGVLPTLARLRQQGAYGRLRTFDHHRAETPWTTFLTGCSPTRTGYWSPIRFREGSYEIEVGGAYDFREYPPFYALGEGYRVAVFDVPQTVLSDEVDGVQVLAWGAHSPQGASCSRPEGLLEELIERHGAHPTLHSDHKNIYDLDALRELRSGLVTGIERRAAICSDLLRRENWDLFLTIFGSLHAAGHDFWHLSDPEHPLHSEMARQWDGDPLRDVFVAVDRAIGEILAAAADDAHVVVFAAHGMGPNVLDLPSMLFLPELLYRFSFPGRAAIAPGQVGAAPRGALSSERIRKEGWPRSVWNLTRESSRLKTLLKRKLPQRYFHRLAPAFGAPSARDPDSPFVLFQRGQPECFQPAVWFKRFWPEMKAFALPTFSEGYIRINLEGREPSGIVSASAYDRLCNELTDVLSRVVDAHSGKPIVKEVIRTRSSAGDRDPRRPDADLVVIWTDGRPTDVVDSPELGRIGPVPFFRAGSHTSDGFVLLKGPAVEPGSSLPQGHSLDLAPTVLRLLNAPLPAHLEGAPLLFRDAAQA
jgi:predicted AlkP superfamily phosphohydrolase/phosphomutase